MARPPNNDKLLDSIERLTTAVNRLVTSVEVLSVTVSEIAKTVDDHEGRLRKVEQSSTTLNERMTNWQFVQGTYTTVMAAGATILGAIFGRR